MNDVARTIRSTAIASLFAAGLVTGLVACSTSTDRAARPSRDRTTTTTATSAPEPAVHRPTGPVDALVPVGPDGARMHLVCSGAGPSTVVLVSGFGDAGDSWGAV